MNKTQIQNNTRKASGSYLKTEYSAKDFRYPTDPSPNKENYSKSYLKPTTHTTLQNHLVKTTLAKTSVVNLFVKKEPYFDNSEQQTEIKLNSCQLHKKRLKYEFNGISGCSKCAIEYAISEGIQINYCQLEKKMLTFGQDEEHDMFTQFSSGCARELQSLNSIPATGDGVLKKRELRDFIIKVGDIISQNIQHVKQVQECASTKQTSNKFIHEIQSLVKSIVQELQDKNGSAVDSNQFQRQSNLLTLKSTLMQQINDLQNIKKDIMENVENIISCMDVPPFKIIINKYNDKLKVFEETLAQVNDKLQNAISSDYSIHFKKVKELQFKLKLSLVLKELFEQPKIQLEQQKNLMMVVNSNTKFLQLLNKVNTNQNSNQMFYQSLLKESEQKQRK